MKNKTKGIDVSSVAPFFLFAIFAICVVSVLFTGAGLYRQQIQRDQNGYNERTVSQYITTRIRQGDKLNSFFIGDLQSKTPAESGNTFFYRESINGVDYYTCIYCCEGYLYELFTAADAELDPSAGERIAKLQSLSFSSDGRILNVSIVHENGLDQRLSLCLRSLQEGLK